MGLKEKRISAGLTQVELSGAIGVSQAAIALWEGGKAFPSSDKLPALAKALGCTIDELFADKVGEV